MDVRTIGGGLPRVPSVPALDHLRDLLPYLSLAIRKEIMTFLRVGVMPHQNTQLRKRHYLQFRRLLVYIPSTSGTKVMTGADLLTLLHDLMQTPTRRGILSLYLRCVPIHDPCEWKVAVQSGLEKEISATQCTSRVATLIYPFLSSYKHSALYQMSPNYPHRPFLMVQLHTKFLQWRRALSRHLYIPQCSHKTIGRQSRDYLAQRWISTGIPAYHQDATTVDLERYYSETGAGIEGACEVRMAWKYNDLKPRVYYAIGGSSYFAARYVHYIFDSLQRSFPTTDPNRRFSFIRFPYVNFTHQVFMIYDYTSFTSMLIDFRVFVDQLAEFVGGCRAKAFDSHIGLTVMDLRELLLEYNRVCNQDGTFDVARVVPPGDDNSEYVILHHRVAGMLGVYGNIVGSTVLHGLTGIVIAGDEDAVNTIGDDAAGVYDVDDMTLTEIQEAILTIGDIERGKFKVWYTDQSQEEDHVGWHYTKRPVNVDYGAIMQQWMPDFPIVPNIMGIRDGQHTVHPTSFYDRRRLLIKQSIRLLESLHRHTSLVDDVDVQMVLDFLQALYKRMNLPLYGSFPNRHAKIKGYAVGPDTTLCTPPLIEESIRNGWWTTLKERGVAETGVVTVPVMEMTSALPDRLTVGVEFRYKGDRVLALIEKLGYVRKEVEVEDRLLTEETLRILEDLAFRKRVPVYKYVVLEEYRPWETYVASGMV